MKARRDGLDADLGTRLGIMAAAKASGLSPPHLGA
jgi:hypothetical protein